MSVLSAAGSESSLSGLLTCITCRVGFRDSDLQRDHYKSDWHRYNLKRKIVNLPPVTAENFADRCAAQELLQAEASKDTTQYCTICKKSFGNEKALQSHVVSKKHSEMVKQFSKDGGRTQQSNLQQTRSKGKSESEEGVSVGGISSSPGKSPGLGGKKFTQQSPQPITRSAFPGKGQKLEEDSSDDDSWEEVEGTPIPPTTCLFCSEESSDIEANLEHMSLVHSFFIPDVEYCVCIEELLEYLGCKVGEGMRCLWCNEKGKTFYDVLAVQQHMRDKGHCRIFHEGDAQFEFIDYYNYSYSYPDNCNDINPDEPYQPEQIRYNENMQLVLPSGVAVGHRVLRRYYRQYVRPGSKTSEQIKLARKNKILSQYKAIGYGQIPASVAQQKLRDQRYFKLVKDKYRVKLGIQGNKTLQHHYRAQVQF